MQTPHKNGIKSKAKKKKKYYIPIIYFIFISEVNQTTIPLELPIVGEPDVDVLLSTVFPKGPTVFQLDGKRLQLLQPLDRDADNLSHMVFQVTILAFGLCVTHCFTIAQPHIKFNFTTIKDCSMHFPQASYASYLDIDDCISNLTKLYLQTRYKTF